MITGVIAPDASAPKAPGSGSSAPGGPTTIADLEAQENATVAIWERMPFTTRHAMFVTRKANFYGDYDARTSNVFAPGEKLITYMEALGYVWATQGDRYRHSVSVDLEIQSKTGASLFSQKDVLKQEVAGRYRNRDTYINITFSVDDAPAGDYVMVYTLHDLGSDRTTCVEQPFSSDRTTCVEQPFKVEAASAAAR